MITIKPTIRVPEKSFIQTLLIKRYSAEEVINELTRLRIPIPTNFLKQIWEELKQTNPGYFTDASKEPEEEWLDELGILEMYCFLFSKYTDKSLLGCEGSFKMLDDPQTRKILYVLSFAGIAKGDIELIVNGKYNISYESPDFTMFFQYFANFEEWTHTDKELFLETVTDKEIKQLLKIALKGDRYYTVWKLNLGTDPNISFEQLMRDMMTDMFYSFKENQKIRPEDALKFAQLFGRFLDRMNDNEANKKETSDILSKLKFKVKIDKTSDASAIKDASSSIEFEIPAKTEIIINSLEEIMNSNVPPEEEH